MTPTQTEIQECSDLGIDPNVKYDIVRAAKILGITPSSLRVLRARGDASATTTEIDGSFRGWQIARIKIAKSG